MAFNTTGTFSPTQQTQELSPLEQLMQIGKKKKAGASAPANTYSGINPVSLAPGTVQKPVTAAPVEEQAPDRAVILPRGSEPKDSNPMPDPLPAATSEIHYISDDPTSPYYWATLGYADAGWAGLPYEQGYWIETPAPEGWDPAVSGEWQGEWVQVRDMTSIAQQMYDLAHTAMPTSPTLIDLQSSAPFAGIQGLINLWTDPTTTQTDMDAAMAQFEQQMGMAPGGMATIMDQMLTQLGTGEGGQQGLSQQYNDTWNQETGLEMQRQRDDFQLMLEALGAQGRSVAGFQAMDNIALSMASYQNQRDMTLLNANMARQETEYAALWGRWDSLFNMGQMTTQQYLDNINQNRVNALQGYAQEISTLVQQNQLTLAQYSADLQAAETHANIAYQSIMADMGVTESAISSMQGYYEMYMAPYYAELERWALQEESDAADSAQMQTGLSIAAGGAGLMVFGGPVGLVVGGIMIIGGIVTAMTSGTVICTELHDQGLMTEEEYLDEFVFGKIVEERRPDVYAGYRIFADPVVRFMKRHKLFSRFVAVLVRQWAKEMKFLVRGAGKGSFVGKIINTVGFRVCSRLAEVKYGLG